MFKRLLILGASRGLGRAVARYSYGHLSGLEEMTLVSRKIELLKGVAAEVSKGLGTEGVPPYSGTLDLLNLDLAAPDDHISLSESIGRFDLVVYCAGGGPHGLYSVKEFKDHQWALNLNLIGPMMLVHPWLKSRRDLKEPGRFIVVGSRIAEQNPDPMATSYAAAKHGLYGFVSSIQDELRENSSKVWLFSPGYMNTEMLPLTAKVRHDGSKLMSPETAAQALLRWVDKDGPWHRVLN